ncbi:guanylate-binding protein 6 [Xenopus laevis]|uniref:Guanylate-binding protein 6 n=1 Tax=Xenopus laevis TaxID=8355 RepID=A0A8J1LT79_XENLA|nr:guanylate-binding protein 6 [Xenopus laevis]
MAPIPKMNQPICLIENEPDKKICLNQEAKQILEKISQPLVVVSIVGPYRSGKSYLMNKLARVKKGGFPLGHTVEAKTKGIWMWCVPHPDKSARTLVLLDTEGLGDVLEGDTRNERAILSLSLLLSSALVYNSKGTIDEDAVKTLPHSATSELSESIMRRSSLEEENLGDSPFTPLFVWAVRNFTLKIELEGQAATSDEYLENSLKEISCKYNHGNLYLLNRYIWGIVEGN